MTNDCKSEQQISNNAFRFKFLGGGVLGLINSTAVTPFINYTNHTINQYYAPASTGAQRAT